MSLAQLQSSRFVGCPVFSLLIDYTLSFATQSDVRARGAWYRTRARDALKQVLEQICVETLQACILVGNNCMGDGDTDTESLYLGRHTTTQSLSFPRSFIDQPTRTHLPFQIDADPYCVKFSQVGLLSYLDSVGRTSMMTESHARQRDASFGLVSLLTHGQAAD